MDNELEKYLKKYMNDIEVLCENLIISLQMNTKIDLFKDRYLNNKWSYEKNGFNFKFHGIGCSAENDNFYYDWDFGYGSRWCGINPYLFVETMRKNRVILYDFREVQEQCEKAINDGLMYKKYDLYYFVIPKDQLISPRFPNEFDTMIIQHFDEEYIIKRCKVIDRFLRKSNRIDKRIENYRDKYILRFLLKGKEVGQVYYSDIGYPEKAIELMNVILK